MDNSDSKSKQEYLKGVREMIGRNIADLNSEMIRLMIKIQKEYPPWPHDGISEQEIQDRNRLGNIPQEIARAYDQISNFTLQSSEIHLSALAYDSKWIKWLTVVLVILTIVLASATILDILVRVGVKL